jgi:hypothetical protein
VSPSDDADDVTTVDPADRDRLEERLAAFAGEAAVDVRPDGTVVASFGGRAEFAVGPDGAVAAGMALHAFEGTAERLRFDHDAGEIHVEGPEVDYTFRRP